MQEQDEPNLLKVLDETEGFRRQLQAELNAVGWSREVLEDAHGKVYSTDELRLEWEVVGFFAPLVVVKSKADGGLGSFEFQHRPRFYFNYQKDDQ
jgi:hypothetical protein